MASSPALGWVVALMELWARVQAWREERRQDREDRARRALEAFERQLRIERANNPTTLDLAERLDRIEKRLDRWEQFGKPTTKEWS